MIHLSNYKKFESKKKGFPDIKKVQLDGFTILVGKDAQSNDYLTFQIAKDDDIWLHVRGYKGSHVVIKINEVSVTKENTLPMDSVIKMASELAKKHSKSPKEPVKVVYCKRKFVTKKPGMNVGQVEVDPINSHEIVI